MQRKTLKADDDAVSPVIGVILMVAITVILAAVIGTFVLGLGKNVKSNPQAGITFEEDTGAGNVEVTLNSIQRADTITVECSDGSTTTLNNVGESTTCSNSGEIQVRATYKGNTAVIDEWEP